jgi:hypothetical protein
MEIYEDNPDHCDIVHNWFPAEVAEQKKTDQRRCLQTLLSMEKYTRHKFVFTLFCTTLSIFRVHHHQ